MENSKSDAVSSQTLVTGKHYYSDGRYLRAKHQLAGDKFVKWVLGLIPSWATATILDAGGGWGRFVWPLVDIYHVTGKKVVLTDLSRGMLNTALEEASQRAVSIDVAVGNIEALPCRGRLFDIVMANHVLYHLQDIPQGVSELARVIKPDGRLLATTNSDKITATIIALHYEALETLAIPFTPEPPSSFSMENGGELLASQFRQVEQHYYEDEELIYDAAEIRATYETIGRYHNLLLRDDVSEQAKRELPHIVEQLAQEVIASERVLRSPTLMGAFVCADPL
jgi:ubiquinone/menaquinone biosynthesis C-methylase UbiE